MTKFASAEQAAAMVARMRSEMLTMERDWKDEVAELSIWKDRAAEAESYVESLTAERDVAMKAAATERIEADMLRRNRDKYQQRGAEMEALKVELYDARAERDAAKDECNRAWAECEKVDARVDELSAKCADLLERLRVTELDGSRSIVRWQLRYQALRADLEQQSREPERVLGSVMADFLLRIDNARGEKDGETDA